MIRDGEKSNQFQLEEKMLSFFFISGTFYFVDFGHRIDK